MSPDLLAVQACLVWRGRPYGRICLGLTHEPAGLPDLPILRNSLHILVIHTCFSQLSYSLCPIMAGIDSWTAVRREPEVGLQHLVQANSSARIPCPIPKNNFAHVSHDLAYP